MCMLSAVMVLHHLQPQPLSEYTPALIVWFMTPAALGDSSINLSKLHGMRFLFPLGSL